MPRLIHPTISGDTLACAGHLLEGLESGEVTGAVIAILYRRKRYSIHVCGEAHDAPTYARGIVGAIEDELRDLIQERGQSNTTR